MAYKYVLLTNYRPSDLMEEVEKYSEKGWRAVGLTSYNTITQGSMHEILMEKEDVAE